MKKVRNHFFRKVCMHFSSSSKFLSRTCDYDDQHHTTTKRFWLGWWLIESGIVQKSRLRQSYSNYYFVGTLVIQVPNSKIDFNMEALSISCRNKHWSQYFNLILFSSTCCLTICPAVIVQAALESRAACITTAGHNVK